MKLPRVVLATATGLLLLSVTAGADAPPDQYDTFGKTTDHIRDRHTLLQWDRFDLTVRTTQLSDDEKFCQARATLGGPGRLPTVKELLTLVDETPHDEIADGGTASARAIDRNAFPATPVDHDYASTDGKNGFWLVDFHSGVVTVASSAPTEHYVRCVFAE